MRAKLADVCSRSLRLGSCWHRQHGRGTAVRPGTAEWCPCSHQQDCHTVMKTVRCKVYEQQEITCNRTVYDRVCEDKVINVTRMVPETCRRKSATRSASRCGKPATRCYTVCKPVWETKTRCYTVCKPVWETTEGSLLHGLQAGVGNQDPLLHRLQAGLGNQDRDCYTVCKPVWETKTRCYTVCKPVWETKTRCYTVCKPVWETHTRRKFATPSASRCGKPRPAATRSASRCRKPVSVKICYHGRGAGSLHQDDPGAERSLGNRRRTKSPARSATSASASRHLDVGSLHLPCVYMPGVRDTGCAKCPPIKCCKKVWVP